MSRTRQLAAIMFTDIVGYTAIMQQDERMALKLRTRHREVFESTTAKYQGKILQYYGDGTLSIFNSAIEAVRCGVELQQNFIKDPEVPVRIGIHSGDIIYDNQDVIGDGVNIASRIESLAQPGSVLISEKVHDEVKNQTDLSTKSLGKFHLKNVKEPIEVFALNNEGLTVPEQRSITGKLKPSSKLVRRLAAALVLVALAVFGVVQLKSPTSRSQQQGLMTLAVLPFDNLSGDPDQEYFSEGMTEDIITQLSGLSNLRVTSRTSTKRFKDTQMPLKEIGRKLKVSHVLEGSVRKYGEQVRVVAQLIEVDTDEHVWAETYDQELSMANLFDIQSNVATQIYAALKGVMLPQDSLVQNTLPTDNLKAYETYLKGLYHYRTFDYVGLQLAIQYYDSAIVLDPNFALAYAGLAHAYATAGTSYGWLTPKEAVKKAKANCIRALELNSTLASARTVMGDILYWFEYNWQEAELEYKLALELDPYHVGTMLSYALMLATRIDRQQEAWPLLQRCMELEPENILVLSTSAWTNLNGRRYAEAINYAQKALQIDPELRDARNSLGLAYLFSGDTTKAQEEIGRWGYNSTKGFLAGYVGDLDSARIYLDRIFTSQENYYVPPVPIAWVYAGMSDINGTMEWLDRAYENGDRGLIFLNVSPVWDRLREHEEFQALVEKVGL